MRNSRIQRRRVKDAARWHQVSVASGESNQQPSAHQPEMAEFVCDVFMPNPHEAPVSAAPGRLLTHLASVGVTSPLLDPRRTIFLSYFSLIDVKMTAWCNNRRGGAEGIRRNTDRGQNNQEVRTSVAVLPRQPQPWHRCHSKRRRVVCP